MRKIAFILSSILTISISAQVDHIPVLSHLEGDELLEALQTDYKPSEVLTYGMARDTMFAIIDNVNDSISCIYSDFRKYLDPTQDPTQYLYEDGGPLTINTEHSYPQSKGAGQFPARSDLHHLFPTRTPVNSERGSDIFAEIDDNATTHWFFEDQVFSQIPINNIDLYSEAVEGKFEPRENHKGNIARAMFYFFTMYRTEALNADPDYFEQQRNTLCDWHYYDPVDQTEWDRTFAIATYQDQKTNPFVLDCSLASRLYCEEELTCKTLPVVDINGGRNNQIKISPNPSNGKVLIEFSSELSDDYDMEIYNQMGQRLSTIKQTLNAGHEKFSIDQHLSSGMYILLFTNKRSKIRITKKLIVQ